MQTEVNQTRCWFAAKAGSAGESDASDGRLLVVADVEVVVAFVAAIVGGSSLLRVFSECRKVSTPQ